MSGGIEVIPGLSEAFSLSPKTVISSDAQHSSSAHMDLQPESIRAAEL
jgi:hypothetical protein